MLVLWTDVLIYLLVLATVILAAYMTWQPHLRRPLNKLLASPIAMGSLTLLLVFAGIGLLDSVHFKLQDSHRNEVISVLDWLCDDIRQHTEKTYSAPFAAYGYGKEMLTAEDGSASWAYPRLQYGAAHLQYPEQQWLLADR